MVDQTGCEPLFAKDNLFAMGLDQSMIGCSLSIVAFTVCFAVFLCIMLLVAALRTYVIFHNRKRKLQQLLSVSSWMSILTLVQSWLCVALYLIILVVFHTYGAGDNVFVFLLGMESLLFGIGSDQWVAKLIRLGSRIIGPTRKQVQQMNSQQFRPMGSGRLPRQSVMQIADAMSHSDRNLKAISMLNRFVLGLQFLFLCILAMVFQTQRIWLRAGIALLAVSVFLSLVAALWQYHRCENAMLETQRNIEGKQSAPHWIDVVRWKFLMHRLVLASIGIPGIITILLWAIEVIPINYIMLIVFGVFDVATNSIMILTFLQRRHLKTGGTIRMTNHTSSPPTRDHNPNNTQNARAAIGDKGGEMIIREGSSAAN